MTRTLALLALVATLSGCGKVATLQSKPGMTPVPVAHGLKKPQTAEQLIQPDTQSRPQRNVELLTHSERRPEDPFELPPGPDNGRPH